MKKLLKTALLATFGILSLNATAGQSINNLQVKYIATGWTAEGIYVETVEVNTIPGCGPRYMISPTNPMLTQMMTLLLSAYHTKSKVDLYVDGCVFGSQMLLKSVAIRQ